MVQKNEFITKPETSMINYAYLTIVRYPGWLAWAGFLSMALFRLPMRFNKKAGFYKLLGCGKNGTFDKTPDLRQWGLLMVMASKEETGAIQVTADYRKMYGGFIAGWWKIFKCTKWTLVLQPIEGHGRWDGKEVFGPLPRSSPYDGVLAVLTRATIRLSRLTNFWQQVEGVARNMSTSKGFITSLGVGEVPWIKQATFSIWENKESMKAFSYKMQEHAAVIKKTRTENWYSEDMFVRFKILASVGLIQNNESLHAKIAGT